MMEPCWALFYQDLLILTLHGQFRGPCRFKMVPWTLVELNNDQISVGQPHPALGLKPLNNDRSLGHLVKALWIFSFPSLSHQYNTIGKPQTEPCRYTSYIHQYVKKPSILAYIDMSRHISLFSEQHNSTDITRKILCSLQIQDTDEDWPKSRHLSLK